MSTRLLAILLLVIGSATGCTRSIRIPESDYDDLPPGKAYKVRTTEGDLYQVRNVVLKDTTLTVSGPQDPFYDHTKYPVEIGMSRVASIERVETHIPGPFVESGFEAGSNAGDDSNNFIPWFLFFEMGYLRGARFNKPDLGWGFGGTVYGLLGEEGEGRMALKGRIRNRFHPKWAVDFAPGVIFAAAGDVDAGFVASLGLAYSSWLTARAEMMVIDFNEWRSYDSTGGLEEIHPAGTEVSFYGGLALRGEAGWVTTGVYAAVILIGAVSLAASLGGLSD